MRMLPGCLTLKSLYSVQWLGHDLAYLPNSERWAPLPHCELGTFVSTELSKTEERRIPGKFLQKSTWEDILQVTDWTPLPSS